jgi:hypothetical protein
MSAEGKEPYPFLPNWTLKLAGIEHQGKGLLPPALQPLRDGIESFSVKLGSWSLTVLPLSGRILFDSRIVHQEKDSELRCCSLLWYRRMEKQIATADKNTAADRCLWYGVGLKSPTGRTEYRLFEDGKCHRSP